MYCGINSSSRSMWYCSRIKKLTSLRVLYVKLSEMSV